MISIFSSPPRIPSLALTRSPQMHLQLKGFAVYQSYPLTQLSWSGCVADSPISLPTGHFGFKGDQINRTGAEDTLHGRHVRDLRREIMRSPQHRH